MFISSSCEKRGRSQSAADVGDDTGSKRHATAVADVYADLVEALLLLLPADVYADLVEALLLD